MNINNNIQNKNESNNQRGNVGNSGLGLIGAPIPSSEQNSLAGWLGFTEIPSTPRQSEPSTPHLPPGVSPSPIVEPSTCETFEGWLLGGSLIKTTINPSPEHHPPHIGRTQNASTQTESSGQNRMVTHAIIGGGVGAVFGLPGGFWSSAVGAGAGVVSSVTSDLISGER